MLIHKKSDRIKVEFSSQDGSDMVTAYFAPLTMADKTRLVSLAPNAQTADTLSVIEFSRSVIKASLKDIKGLTNSDDSQYVLEMGSDGLVKDECLEDIMNLPELFSKVMTVSSMFLSGVPKEGQLISPVDGKPIEGIVVKKS